MKQINIREALLELDRKTDARYDLTTLYEACKLDDEDKQQLVKYIDAYDHPATINKFLSSKCDAITEALGDDDVSDMKIIDEINDGGDRTLWSLMNKFEDEDLQLKDLTEDVDPEVLEGRLDSIEYAMNTYAKDSIFIDDVQGSGKDWKVTYNDVTVDVTFDTDWEEYTYYINGKGPYCHSSYEYIVSDIMNFVDYNHLGQSDDEVDESLGETPDENPIIAWLGEHEQAWEDFTAHFVGRDISELSDDEIIGWISEHDQLYADYKNYFKVDESLNEGVDTSNLEPQIKEVVTAVMQENGYEADEIEAYTAVEIKDTVDDMIQVEVRAELGYDDLMELCDKLNPIVAAVDHRAYFEPVTSGIARAFIRNDQSDDIADEHLVAEWAERFNACTTKEELVAVYKDLMKVRENILTGGTLSAIYDVVDAKLDSLSESLTEETSSEIRYQVTADMIDMDAVYSEHTNLKDAIASAREAQQSYTNVKIKDVRDGSSWQDIDNAEADLKDGLVESTKLTLNESDDTDILYDMEYYDEDNTTVTAGNSFIEDGHTWTWFRQCGESVHLDFDNWAVWWAYRPETEDDMDSPAVSGFFVVDTDTGFIDWGPCDTVKEAQEFLQSKVNDWENDDIDESKSIKEANKIAYSNEKYKGYMIRQDRKYGCYNVYDKQDEMEDSGFKTIDAAKEFIDSLEQSKSIKEDVDKYQFSLPYADFDDMMYQEEAAKKLNLGFEVKYRDGNPRAMIFTGSKEDLTRYCNNYGQDERDIEPVNESKSMNEDVNSAANSLFDLLKDYGAISVDKDVDVTRISFRNSEDDSDATLVHHCILSKGYKELTQYGNNPNVTEYMNEAGDTCVKLLIYDDSIAVEVSAEYASQDINVDESLKESVEKYIIIAKEGGLNLYYNATDDNFGTDMKAATQYEERAVALDDYKAIKERYPNAYIRSMYDLPLLNKPSKKEGFEEDEWDDDELASIYGGDTKNDIPDGVETPEETEARLAKGITENIEVTIQKGDNTATGGRYFNIFPQRKNPEFDWEQFQKYINSNAIDVSHFTSVEEAKEFFADYCKKHNINSTIDYVIK